MNVKNDMMGTFLAKEVSNTLYVMYKSDHTLNEVKQWFKEIPSTIQIEEEDCYDIFLYYIYSDHLDNIKFYNESYFHAFISSIWDRAKGIIPKSKFKKYSGDINVSINSRDEIINMYNK